MSGKGPQTRHASEGESLDGVSEPQSWLRKAVADLDGTRPRLPAIGELIGDKYRVEGLIGRGGMGAVFRAVHVVSEKPVALKWMLRSASDQDARHRFVREARAAGRIDHPNVVDIYDIGQDGDAAYLVMELLRGESLRERLGSGQLGIGQAVALLLPAMRGVAAAHRQSVIHRDLKPDNIFLCRGPDGEAREAKVLDFGISTIRAVDGQGHTTLTHQGMVLGTPAYMCPEQLESARDVDGRADVYAFGVILYEALTGRVPFSAESYSALVLAITNQAPAAPRKFRPELPDELEQVVLRAMAKEREERPASVEGLIAALQPFATGESSGASQTQQPESSSLSDGSLAFAATRRSERAATAKPIAPAPRSKRGIAPIVVLALFAALVVAWLWRAPSPSPTAASSAEHPAPAPAPATPPANSVEAHTASPTAIAHDRPAPAQSAPAASSAPSAQAPPPGPDAAMRAATSRPRKARAAHLAQAESESAAAASESPNPPPAKRRAGAIRLDEL